MEEYRYWQAKWIWDHEQSRISKEDEHSRHHYHALVYFRRTFIVPEGVYPKLVLDMTADSRYRLFVNGISACIGPCKGDRNTHYYESVDISDLLKPGINVIAVKVLHFGKSDPFRIGEDGPISIWRSQSGGLLVEGILRDESGAELETLHTDDRWKCRYDPSYRLAQSKLTRWLNVTEEVKGSSIPHGWETRDYDDSSWRAAIPFSGTRNEYGELTGWSLTPRPIPFLYEKEMRFRQITRHEGVEKEEAEAWIRNQTVRNQAMEMKTPLIVGSGKKLVLELDAGELTTGYWSLSLRKGSGSIVCLLGAECYEPIESGEYEQRIKGLRDDTAGKLVGEIDVYCAAGAGGRTVETEIYEPFWFRTFRYVRLEVEAGDEPLEIAALTYRETGYPLDIQAEFACSDDELNSLWDLSVRTLRRCMHETYQDCPYYEQLQYTMDTRLQMLFTYQLGADDRLARRAIFDFHSSQLPSGILQCRYPSVYPQVIPSFSLYWIHMIYDHYRYFGDAGLVKRYRPTMMSVLNWFEHRLAENGLVGPTPNQYWSYIDNVDDWPNGIPERSEDLPSALLSLMYAAALGKAGELLDATGWSDAAAEMRQRAQALNHVVLALAWSSERQLFRDTPGLENYSQHSQVWAVLSGAVTGDEARSLMERMLQEKITVVSLPEAYALFRALEETGLYHRAFEQWNRWRVFLDQHLTTLPEIAHAVPRSDCHAWSALPLIEFPYSILGVQPGGPGYREIRIEPNVEGLSWAKGRVATVQGPVDVSWKASDGGFTIEVKAPEGIPAVLVLPDAMEHRFTGAISRECR